MFADGRGPRLRATLAVSAALALGAALIPVAATAATAGPSSPTADIAGTATANSPAPSVVPGAVLVTLAPEKSFKTAWKGVRGKLSDRERKRSQRLPGTRTVAVFTTPERAAQLEADPLTRSVEPNLLLRPASATSATLTQSAQLVTSGYSGTGTTIAVLDTGVSFDGPQLSGKRVHPACFSTNWPALSATSLCPGEQAQSFAENSAEPCAGIAGCDHGTHVAATAGGRSHTISSGPYSGTTVTGLAPDASILPVQVFTKFTDPDFCGSANPCTAAFASDVALGIQHASAAKSDHGVNVVAINLSLGGESYSASCTSSSYGSSIKAAHDLGVAVVAANGNNGYTGRVSTPSCVPHAIGVGATKADQSVASYSNVHSTLTDLLAVGTGVVAEVPGGYAVMSGTSMAAPQVAGVMAQLSEAAPTASVDEKLAALQATGSPIGVRQSGSGTTSLGFERPFVQVADAATALANVEITPEPQPPVHTEPDPTPPPAPTTPAPAPAAPQQPNRPTIRKIVMRQKSQRQVIIVRPQAPKQYGTQRNFLARCVVRKPTIKRTSQLHTTKPRVRFGRSTVNRPVNCRVRVIVDGLTSKWSPKASFRMPG